MNFKNVEIVHKQHMKLINEIMKIGLTMSPAEPLEEWEQKKAKQDELYKQLELLPTLEKAGEVPVKMGRPPIGKARPVKITLPEEDWKHIEMLVETGRVKSYADYFRDLHTAKYLEFLYLDGKDGRDMYDFANYEEPVNHELLKEIGQELRNMK